MLAAAVWTGKEWRADRACSLARNVRRVDSNGRSLLMLAAIAVVFLTVISCVAIAVLRLL